MTRNTLFCILFALFTPILLEAQLYQELKPMPEAVSNNAVCSATAGGENYMYSFAGLDSTKLWSGLHLKAWRYSIALDLWENLPDVPDPMGGKIAAGASTVKNKIYVLGGYHVLQNGNEISSNKVHIFNPETNAWEADGTPMPVPVDDHVQVVWRDSLIFVVTGWSNTTNVPNVQIYNPSTNEWTVGTSVPNNIRFKVFGASGAILNDTLYYMGGARFGNTFPATNNFRKGAINPDNPNEITWAETTDADAIGYRMAAGLTNNLVVWMGGSTVTYNYDGIAYNGSGGVNPSPKFRMYDPRTGDIVVAENAFPPIMDLRGAAMLNTGKIYIAGGMGENQQVTNKTYVFEPVFLLDTPADLTVEKPYRIFPNPILDFVKIETKKDLNVQFYNEKGQIVLEKQTKGLDSIDCRTLAKGSYFLHFFENRKRIGVEKIAKM